LNEYEVADPGQLLHDPHNAITAAPLTYASWLRELLSMLPRMRTSP
jgi:hypothetical protein